MIRQCESLRRRDRRVGSGRRWLLFRGLLVLPLSLPFLLFARAAFRFSLILLFGAFRASLLRLIRRLVSLRLARGLARGFGFLLGPLTPVRGGLGLLGLSGEFLFAASFFHLSLLLLGITIGLFPGSNIGFLLPAGGLGLGLPVGFHLCLALGFHADPFCLGFCLAFCFSFASFRFDTRALGLGLSIGVHLCLAF